MGKEVELKLALASECVEPLQAHPVLAEQALHLGVQRLLNTYYDTPARDLQRQGLSLRVRQVDGRCIQGLKWSSSPETALNRRGEWEVAASGLYPDCNAFAGQIPDALLGLLRLLNPDLQPVCETCFERSQWRIQVGKGTHIHLALDQGVIRVPQADTEPLPLCELELELVKGSRKALLKTALRLAADIPLHAEHLSKAARGFLLADGWPPAPSKTVLPKLKAKVEGHEGLTLILASCQQALLDNLSLLRSSSPEHWNPEWIHQARVALRRLRTTLKVIQPVMPKRVEVLNLSIRQLGAALGQVRDLDVLCDSTLPPLAEQASVSIQDSELEAWLLEEHTQAQLRLQEALKGINSGMALLGVEYLQERLREKSLPNLHTLAKADLKKLCRRAIMAVSRLQDGRDSERWHDLRIALKRLRYALEAFEPVLQRKLVKPWLGELADIQELLGAFNDHEQALVCLKRAQLSLSEEAQEPLAKLIQVAEHQQDVLKKLAGIQLETLLALPLPWQKREHPAKA